MILAIDLKLVKKKDSNVLERIRSLSKQDELPEDLMPYVIGSLKANFFKSEYFRTCKWTTINSRNKTNNEYKKMLKRIKKNGINSKNSKLSK